MAPFLRLGRSHRRAPIEPNYRIAPGSQGSARGANVFFERHTNTGLADEMLDAGSTIVAETTVEGSEGPDRSDEASGSCALGRGLE